MKSRRSAQAVPREIGIGCGRLRGLRGSSVPGSGPRARGTGLASPSSPRMLTGLGPAPALLLRTGTCSSAFDDGSEQRQFIFQLGWGKKRESHLHARENTEAVETTRRPKFNSPHIAPFKGPFALGGLMAPASVNSSSGSAPGRRRVFSLPMDMGEGSARCLAWWHEQWASFGLDCVLCWADRGEIDLAHHFSPGRFLWATRAYGFRRLPSMEFIPNLRITTPPAFRLQTARPHPQKHQIYQSAAAATAKMGWHMAHMHAQR